MNDIQGQCEGMTGSRLEKCQRNFGRKLISMSVEPKSGDTLLPGTLDAEDISYVINSCYRLQSAIAANNFEKGWRDPEAPHRNFGELISLIHSETSEALEAFRDGDDYTEISYEDDGKPVGVASELADVIIRVLDMADEMNIPVIEAVIAKHRYNQTRPYRHGNKKI